MTLTQILNLPHLTYVKNGRNYELFIEEGYWMTDYTGDPELSVNFTQYCILPTAPYYPEYKIVTDEEKRQIEEAIEAVSNNEEETIE